MGQVVYTSADVTSYHDIRPREAGRRAKRADQSGALTVTLLDQQADHASPRPAAAMVAIVAQCHVAV